MKILRAALLPAFVVSLGGVACATASASPSSPGAGVVARATRTFSNIRIEGPVNARITFAAAQKTGVDCSESSSAQRVRTRVENDTLIVDSAWEGTPLWPAKPCTIHISTPRLDALVATGAGDVAVHGKADGAMQVQAAGSGDIELGVVRGPRFDLVASGSGSVRISSLQVDDANLSVTGSGGVKVTGRSRAAHVRVTGSGNVDAHDLRVESCDVESSGASDVDLYATRRALVRANGSGDVTIRGEPSDRRAEKTGSGTVRWN